MKRIFLISCLGSFFGFTQTELQFDMYWNNYTMFNPANTGFEYKYFGSAIYRSQWTGVEGAPNNISALYSTKVNKINSGVGIGYMFDKIGFNNSSRLYFNYAYHFNLDNSQLSIGTALVVNRIKFEGLWNAPQTGTTGGLDPNIPNDYQTKLNFNFGFIYKAGNIDFGLSATQINQPYYEKLNFSNQRNYFGYVAYNFTLTSNLSLRTMLNVKTDQVAMAADLYTLFTLKKKYWVGLMYGIASKYTGIQVGADLKEKIRIGYSLNVNFLSTFPNTNQITHEIVFAYLLK